ncbi:MAG: hypothetical protein LBL52_03155 [Rickettsiales bacterium]|jgi:hypothetical protein|nr:hypothetical protein [Rickettsiales bacterium]
MNIENANIWIECFKTAWLGKDLVAIADIFKDTTAYYETPDSEPFRNINDILAQWEDIKPLDWRALDVKVKSITGSDVVMEWSFVCVEPDGQVLEENGEYLVKFDESGRKCLEFVRKVENKREK